MFSTSCAGIFSLEKNFVEKDTDQGVMVSAFYVFKNQL